MNSNQTQTNSIPNEILLQILAHLPIKSIFKFKSVSKQFQSLPKDPYFITLHNRVSSRHPMVLIEVFETSITRPPIISIDYEMGSSEFHLGLSWLNDRVRVRASCNGLICCASIGDKGVYYVCNPMTREFRVLPRCLERNVTRFYPDGEATLVGIACEGDGGKGFSVVLAGNHRSFGHRPEKRFVCKVYDSRTNGWRKFITIQEEDFSSQISRNQVVFARGMLHWLMIKSSCLLVLDLGNDVWRRLALPVGIVGCRVYLLEMDGCVSVVQIRDAWMSIWVLRDYVTEIWEMVDKVSLRCIRGMVPGIFPICQNSKIMFLATYKRVLAYHKRTKVWKEMYTLKNGSALPLWFSAHAFRSSLTSCS
ncbi:hypothetical protein Droror1_Dr00002508 [Drosera rotundifolia]